MKTVCPVHETAYELGEGCPWCEPANVDAEMHPFTARMLAVPFNPTVACHNAGNACTVDDGGKPQGLAAWLPYDFDPAAKLEMRIDSSTAYRALDERRIRALAWAACFKVDV